MYANCHGGMSNVVGTNSDSRLFQRLRLDWTENGPMRIGQLIIVVKHIKAFFFSWAMKPWTLVGCLYGHI